MSAPPSMSQSLGIGALVVGCLAMCLAVVPVIALVAIPLGLLGAGLGAWALCTMRRDGSSVGLAVAGGVVSLLALLVALVMGPLLLHSVQERFWPTPQHRVIDGRTLRAEESQ